MVPPDLELFGNLSTPGKMYLYLADLASTMEGKRGIITDIAILNPTDENIEFESTATSHKNQRLCLLRKNMKVGNMTKVLKVK